MFRTTLALVALLLGGCDFNPEKAFNFLSGRESNVVVISQQPVMLTREKITLTSAEAMKVIGESTSLCFVLRGGNPLQDSKTMDQAFEAAMKGAKVKVDVALLSGAHIALDQPLQAWNLYGKIIKENELSACASAPCNTNLPVGAQVSKIQVSSEPDLRVQGIYWTSERMPLEKPAPPTKSDAGSMPKPQSACPA